MKALLRERQTADGICVVRVKQCVPTNHIHYLTDWMSVNEPRHPIRNGIAAFRGGHMEQ